jgi:kinesin family protein 1
MINSFIKASSSSSDLSRFARLDPSYPLSSLPQMGGSISPSMPKSRSMESLMNTSGIALKYIPSIEEVRVSPVVSRRGYLNFLEEKGTGWVKKFVVCYFDFH